MTKAPYASVAWLSQSSRATKEAGPGGTMEEPARGAQGPPTLGQAPPGRSQGTGTGTGTGKGTTPPPSGAKAWASSASSPPEVFYKGGDPKIAGQRGGEVSQILCRSAPAALVAPKRDWGASECGSDGEEGEGEGEGRGRGSLSEGQRAEAGGGAGGRSGVGVGVGVGGSRRLRTAFSLEQISTLESSFKRQRYLGAAERRKLAAKMQLSEVQIKTWFQNRRMKLKRQMQEMRSEAYHAVPFYSPLPFGPQNGPLSYVYSPHQQTLSQREAPLPSGLPLPPLPAPLVDPRNTSAGQPGTLWPLPLPYVMGYQDPRTVFMTL